MSRFKASLLIIVLVLIFPLSPKENTAFAANSGDVVVNEVAWMGTTDSYNAEWIEIHNTTGESIDLSGWTLKAVDGTPNIGLSGSIPAGGYYLLERTDDSTVSEVSADQIYTGALANSNEALELMDDSGGLVDEVNDWHAGDNDQKATMERLDPGESGTTSTNWADATSIYEEGLGTPKAENSSDAQDQACAESVANVSEQEGAINVYFNKCVDHQYATSGNEANQAVNLEDRLIQRLEQAEERIDFATYELNLPRIAETLINQAANGVEVRIIADAKDADDPHYEKRYQTMRLYVEKILRGADGEIGTEDDAEILSDSPMMAVEDPEPRIELGLPEDASDIPEVTVEVGNSEETGRLFVEGEQKDEEGTYYSPGNQMHNKFALVDGQWVFTGSWNFTVTGLYGSEENQENRVLDGNQQHVIEINSTELADIYETEFNEMWGSSLRKPDIEASNFSTRKTDNTEHQVNINGVPVEVYFSSGDAAIGHMADYVKEEADQNTYFSIFAWSDQSLLNELKYKYEGSYEDGKGTLTGFDIKGVFDSSFWNQWWSASVDMTGRTSTQESEGNPNIRWANPAPVYKDGESRKLHSKTMLIDADTSSDATTIVGSTNWSNNGNNINDENMLFIHDQDITNQFVQEFNARYVQAGGTIE
ncbi:phospholipase D-like domain-containing protein [Halobacillus sp. Marseille-Q1614]|uniref:phospholipase D-like domain-containing protein n=1 Tax=Halobacillus sp. Marseille-Q1614 TaxID=2709134 RepID=UPI0020C3333F|nr:phospholipase D-like domain-containing protein [Halobacillus sp. Marseille-Q1614]